MADPSILSAVSSSFPTNMDMVNSMSSMFTNFMNQRFANQMYKRQRADALEFWNMQNEYNSPANQMQRFKDAGLNPNLIYGQGSPGQAEKIQTPDVQNVQFREPRFDGPRSDLMGALLGAADLRIKNAQADNLQVQNSVIRQDAILRAIQARRGQFDLDFESSMRDTSADFRRAAARKLAVETDISIARDARDAAMNSSNLLEAAQRMAKMKEEVITEKLRHVQTRADTDRLRAEKDRIRQHIDLMLKDGTLRNWEIELSKMNMTPKDPLWSRVVGGLLQSMFDDIQKFPSPLVPYRTDPGKY